MTLSPFRPIVTGVDISFIAVKFINYQNTVITSAMQLIIDFIFYQYTICSTTKLMNYSNDLYTYIYTYECLISNYETV